MTIRMQFVLGSDLSSRLIAWYGQGYGGFSHVDAVLPDGTLLGARNDAIGGQPPGVRIRPPEYEKWANRALVELPATDTQAASWQSFLRLQIGDPYDRGAILGFLLGKQDHASGHWICSALQHQALQQIHFLYPSPIPDSQVTPDSLFQLVTSGLGGKIS